jgi:hypothetical protein
MSQSTQFCRYNPYFSLLALSGKFWIHSRIFRDERVEVLTAVKIELAVFWLLVPCSLVAGSYNPEIH